MSVNTELALAQAKRVLREQRHLVQILARMRDDEVGLTDTNEPTAPEAQGHHGSNDEEGRAD